MTDRRCPDDGRCHHSCTSDDYCFRVRTCGPLSGVFPNDEWPDDVVRKYGSDALEVTDIHQAIIETVEAAHDIDGYDLASEIFDTLSALGVTGFVVGHEIVPFSEEGS